MANRLHLGFAMALLALLSACGGVGTQSVQDWIAETQKSIKPNVKPVPEPKNFVPKAYTVTGMIDPFDNQKLLEALRRSLEQDSANVALLAPERARRKEQLEDFPLDQIQMVGYLNQNSVPVALVSVNKLLYQVKVGNYMGQNYGKIQSITSSGLVLREIVQDASGEWIEKQTNVPLQESASGSSGIN